MLTLGSHADGAHRVGYNFAPWPRWDVPGVGPTAVFSILEAKTHIPPHTGVHNTRLTVHLPLIIPPGGQKRPSQLG